MTTMEYVVRKNMGFDSFYELTVFLLYRDNMPTNSFTFLRKCWMCL